MPSPKRIPWRSVLTVLLFLVPFAHPLLIPAVGVPSHLLWFVHVLPVALVTWARGRRWAVGALLASGGLVLAGERTFGAGFWTPADWQTALSLTVSVTFTNLLIVGFALYARSVAERYRLLFQRVRMGVMRVSGSGRIAHVNPEAGEILEASPEELRNRLLTEVILAPRFSDMEAVAEAGAWSGRMEVRTDSGSKALHAFLVAVPHPDSDEYQVLLSDRSLEVLQAQEIERQAKLAALGEALAGVAHELNNPLTAILGHAALGRDGTEPGTEPRAMFDVVIEQAERMTELTGELLGFSRKDQGAQATSVAELLRRVVRVQRISLGRQVKLELESAWQGELPVESTKFEQILLNLISNSSYAVRSNGGGTVRIESREEGGNVVVEVTDDGPGIDPELLPTIFQAFTTTKPPGEGTGLGLAISRRLARGWGGELEARNRESGGARFVLTLPKERPGSPGAAASGRDSRVERREEAVS